MPLASVSDVESNTEWQQQMGSIAVAALADGEAFGEARNFEIEQSDDLFIENHLGYKIIAVPINDLHQLGMVFYIPKIPGIAFSLGHFFRDVLRFLSKISI